MLSQKEEVATAESVCQNIRDLIAKGKFSDAKQRITDAMASNPHSAEPHNLMGILMEHENDHCLAMKHFRAAWALDPTYRPARYNMEKYASFSNIGFCQDAYEDSDCPTQDIPSKQYKIEYDNFGIGHIVRR